MESTAAPPPPPPLPPPPKVSTPKLVVKPKTTTDENVQGGAGAGGEVEDEGEHLTLVEELKRGNVTLRKTSLQPDFERKTVCKTFYCVSNILNCASFCFEPTIFYRSKTEKVKQIKWSQIFCPGARY